MPTKHSARREARAGQLLDTRGELEPSRRRLEDVGATVCVQDSLRTSEEVSEGLAIIAVADEAIPTRSGEASHDSAKRAARAPNREIRRHDAAGPLARDGVELPGIGHALELVGPPVPELEPGAGDQLFDRARNEHLVGSGK